MTVFPLFRSAAMRHFGRIALLVGVWALMLPAQTSSIKVMTRNMDAGTDFGFIFGATSLQELVAGTEATFAEVDASRIPERAVAIADEIDAARPDVVALQEVTQYWTRTPGGAPQVRYDQLSALLTSLIGRGLIYSPVAVNQLLAAEAPLSSGLLFGIMDSDVILVRAGLATSQAQSHRFSPDATLTLPLPIGNLPLWQGWSSVDVTVGGKTVRVVDTHLLSVFKVLPPSLAVQIAQAGELAQALTGVTVPVILAGDFNANADEGKEHYQTIDIVLGAGFTDAWRSTNAEKGNTWPFHKEDPFKQMAGPYERIDLIFVRGLNASSAERIGDKFVDKSKLWASDHAGVVASIDLQ
jgi:endonuclease/exonuclease/phosphatase family metal-dependent hydrolase